MDQMTIEGTAAADTSVTESAPVVRILSYFHERLENLSADMIRFMKAVDSNDSDAISELEADIRRLYGWSELGDGSSASASSRTDGPVPPGEPVRADGPASADGPVRADGPVPR